MVSLNANRTIINIMGYRIPRLTHLLRRQGKNFWKLWKPAGERCSPCAQGFSRSNFHICQNLILRLTFASQMLFSSKMFGWHCQLITMDWRRCRMCMVVFPHFIMASKNYAVMWPSGWKNKEKCGTFTKWERVKEKLSANFFFVFFFFWRKCKN